MPEFRATEPEQSFLDSVSVRGLYAGEEVELRAYRARVPGDSSFAGKQLMRGILGIQHPDIDRIVEVGISRRRIPYLIVEARDGLVIDSPDLLDSASSAERVRYLRDACKLIEHCNAHLVRLWNLQPSNFRVTDEGRVVLARPFGGEIVKQFGRAAGTEERPVEISEVDAVTQLCLELLPATTSNPIKSSGLSRPIDINVLRQRCIKGYDSVARLRDDLNSLLKGARLTNRSGSGGGRLSRKKVWGMWLAAAAASVLAFLVISEQRPESQELTNDRIREEAQESLFSPDTLLNTAISDVTFTELLDQEVQRTRELYAEAPNQLTVRIKFLAEQYTKIGEPEKAQQLLSESGIAP